MKTNTYLALTLFAGTLLGGASLTSCQQDAVSELQGLYKAPNKVNMTALNSITKVGDIIKGKRTFDVTMTDDKGDTFQATFISGKYFLAGGTYTLSSATQTEDATAGNYLSGATVNGVAIIDGTFSIDAQNIAGKHVYSVKECYIFDAEGNTYAIAGSNDVLGSFEFTPDAPDEVTLCNNVNKLEEGFLTLELITPGYECDESGWPPVYKGTEGIFWQIKFVNENGRLEAGDYYPGYGYQVGSASFLSAELTQLYFGWEVGMDCSWGGGTCISTYSGKEGKCPDRANLTASVIHVERDNDSYHIYTDPTAEAWIDFKGDIPLCNPDAKLGSDYQLTKLYASSNEAVKGEGLHFIDLSLSLGNIAPASTDSTFTGTGRVLKLRMQSEDGQVTLGDYKMVDSYEEFIKNKLLSTKCFLYNVQDGDVTKVSLKGAKLNVSFDETTKLYTLFFKAGEDTYTYVGTLSELFPVALTQVGKVAVTGTQVTLQLASADNATTMQLIMNTAAGAVTAGTYGPQGETAAPYTYVPTEIDFTWTPTGNGSFIKTGEQYHWMMDLSGFGGAKTLIEVTDPYNTNGTYVQFSTTVDGVIYTGWINYYQ